MDKWEGWLNRKVREKRVQEDAFFKNKIPRSYISSFGHLIAIRHPKIYYLASKIK